MQVDITVALMFQSKICEILKKRFNNLTAIELNTLSSEITTAVVRIIEEVK